MAEIKKGDLVMVVRPTPCCSRQSKSSGIPFTVKYVGELEAKCACGSVSRSLVAQLSNGFYYDICMLLKIDPPSQGETTEAYRNLRVPV